MGNIPISFFGVLGLFIGSFLNVCIYRLPRKESIIWPGSHCPECGRAIQPLELIPVLSFIFMRGRCRGCGAGISLRYPAVEILTGLVFYWSALAAGGSWAEFLAYVLFLSGLVVIFFVDLDHWIIPDRVVYPLSAAGLVLAGFRGMLPDAARAALIGFLGFWLIAFLGELLLKKEAMGGGDIKLAGMIGLYLGLELMLTGLFLAFFIGALVSVPLLALRRTGMRDALPFGPMMAAGAAVSLIKGQELINWYGDMMVQLWRH